MDNDGGWAIRMKLAGAVREAVVAGAAAPGDFARPLTVEQILAWADAHHAAHGDWPAVGPGMGSSDVAGAPGESWKAINHALALGLRGLRGDSSLAELLAAERGAPAPDMGPRRLADKIWAWEQEAFAVKARKRKPAGGPTKVPRITIDEVLAWADAHHETTGAWPTQKSGVVRDAPYPATWNGLGQALRNGSRGLPGGSSLARLLVEHRNVGPHKPPALSVEQILAWADAHHAATGCWPHRDSGQATAGSDETWARIDNALRRGHRGLGAKTSLPRLLNERRGVPVWGDPSPLTIEQILARADAFHAAHGRWPTKWDERDAAGPDEPWKRIDHALREGLRGLPGGTTLAWLLLERRKAWPAYRPPDLTIEQILAWADAHRAETSRWPTVDSGAIIGAPGDTWMKVQMALLNGGRGLPERTSLARVLIEHRGARKKGHLPPFGREQILEWADHHYRQTGCWPTKRSGPVAAARGETWRGIDNALLFGYRGLPGGSSLAHALDQGGRGRSRPLSLELILAWAVHHENATGRRPGRHSGAVAAAPGERWILIDNALRYGRRGLPGGSSLAQLLAAHIGQTRIGDGPTIG
jgi:hypothetical protein